MEWCESWKVLKRFDVGEGEAEGASWIGSGIFECSFEAVWVTGRC